MRKEDLKEGVKCIEKQADIHTDKLHEVTVLSVKGSTGRLYKESTRTIVYYKTDEGTFYPARHCNGTHFLDGFVGAMELGKFKRLYKIREEGM